MQEYRYFTHTFEPVYDSCASVLILGSFPSVKSREIRFYYGHPQNRFWKVMAGVLLEDVPVTTEEKKRMLLKHGIALWDVIAGCRIRGSSDLSVKDVQVNDFSGILAETSIGKVFANGDKAYRLYRTYVEPKTGLEAVRLPSTSPANAAWDLDRLCGAWRAITAYCR